jgi:crotonobetainyl-CoA:carnitine CoA-transferase CaiB-like acyl-CoA transferase
MCSCRNFRKGVAERLELDWATLRRYNPRLVYASARSGIMFDRYWPAICNAIGRPELATDERFATMRVRAGNAGSPVHLGETPARIRSTAPELGQHTD